MAAYSLSVSSQIPIMIGSQPQCVRIVARVQARSLRVRASSLWKDGSRLYTPLEVRSLPGKYLSTLLHRDREFEVACEEQLLCLNIDRGRTTHLLNSIDAKGNVGKLCKTVVEDMKGNIQLQAEEIMYMFICRKFLDTGVHMLPRISDCLVYGRLELATSKDTQLESMYNSDVLEFIKPYITRVTRLYTESNVDNKSNLIKVEHSYLKVIYSLAVLHGHFIKSVSSRYTLERLFKDETETMNSFKSYANGLSPILRIMYTLPKSQEAQNMMTKHLKALFIEDKSQLASTKGLVTTSSGTLKRLVLEGLAFGTFLWDAEYFVNKFYNLEDNHSASNLLTDLF